MLWNNAHANAVRRVNRKIDKLYICWTLQSSQIRSTKGMKEHLKKNVAMVAADGLRPYKISVNYDTHSADSDRDNVDTQDLIDSLKGYISYFTLRLGNSLETM